MVNANGQRTIWKKVIFYVRRYWLALGCSLILALVHVATALYIPVLIGKAVDHIVAPGNVEFTAIWELLVWVLGSALLAGVSQWLMNRLNNFVTYRVTRDIRNTAFAHIQVLPLRYLDKHSHGDLVSRVIGDVDTFADGLLLGFTQLFSGVMTIVGTMVFMLTINWRIALVVVCVTPLSLLVANFIANRTYSMFQLQTRTKGEQTALVDEAIGNLKLIKSFGHEDQILEQFDGINDRLKKSSLRAIYFSSLTNPSTRFVYAIVYALVGLFGALLTISGGMTVGGLTSFLSYANQYTKPFNEISGVIAELQNALACAGRVFELIEQPASTDDPADPQYPEPLMGALAIENLSFRYDPDKPLIDDMNLQVSSGQKIAIVGPTGCGKTTFINLLMRFYDPQEGQILLDGVDAQQMERSALRRSVGMVLQDTWLLAGTIRQNIAMGKPDATDEQIVQAAKQAHAHSFIKRLPQGYDTVIGESGGNLSQGQKQLLCIARVMLSLPPMLFLDEATSSIDTRTEQKIQKAFDSMMEGRTSFVVAHRLSTIQEADLILVMKDGCIIEQGKHTDLLARKGFYAELYESQFAH